MYNLFCRRTSSLECNTTLDAVASFPWEKLKEDFFKNLDDDTRTLVKTMLAERNSEKLDSHFSCSLTKKI